MRQCPLCELLYDDGTDFCPQDGRVLFLPDPLLGRIVDGKYRVDVMLGGGGHGAIYRATHVHLQRTAAFKVIRGDFAVDPATTERFKREALAVARLKHPHIVTIHDFGISPDVGAYLVLEYLEGHTLRHEIYSSKVMPLGAALELMRQICSAVDAAHAKGVIHRDLKPDNIFLEVSEDGRLGAKILDFGIATLLGGAEPELQGDYAGSSGSEFTVVRNVFGTPAYMSPEQCAGEYLDPSTDVYSLGSVFYEMLTGRPPFVFTGTTDLLTKQMTAKPSPPSAHASGIPAALDAVILAALEKRREDRIRSADELLRALGGVRDAIAPPPAPASVIPQPSVALPAPVSDVAPPNNLPRQVTNFVGREDSLEELPALLRTSRLLTMTGPGGCGKTRLSLELASRVLGNYPDGVWVVELAAIADRPLVPHAVASALGVGEDPRQPILTSLVRFLESRRLMLILDNCEHLVGACAELVGRLLRAAPHLSVIASSQESLGIPGEIVWPVRPLLLPAEPGGRGGDAAESEAVRLFADRARLSNPRFSLTAETTPLVVGVCRQLDGIPLAIELAAARMKMLSIGQIAERLDDRFKLLTQGDRNAQPRQRTLQGAIDWSYDLLSDEECTLFASLSVFAGGWTLSDAEGVCSSPPPEPCAEGEDGSPRQADDRGADIVDVFDTLSRLVDKSLVVVEEQDGESRYGFLQTIRQYSGRKLRDSGRAPAVRSRHRDYYLALAEEGERDLRGPRQREWLERLEVEHDNLRAALEWSKADASVTSCFLRLSGALAEFWQVRGHAREGREWAEAALEASRVDAPAARAKALHCAGSLARILGDYGIARARLEESLLIRQEIGDMAGVMNALNNLGVVAQWHSNPDRAAALHTEALTLARQHGDEWEAATALINLGNIQIYRGGYGIAVGLYEEGLALFRKIGDRRKVGATLNNLGVALANQREFTRARACLEEQLALQWEAGDTWEIATSLNNLGEIAQNQGDYARAADLLTQSLRLYEKAGDKRGVAYSLECFVSLGSAQGHFGRAARLAGAATALREVIGSPLSQAEQTELDRHLDPARIALGLHAYERAFETGRAMSRERAIEDALAGEELIG
jgi:predicted ATPase